MQQELSYQSIKTANQVRESVRIVFVTISTNRDQCIYSIALEYCYPSGMQRFF